MKLILGILSSLLISVSALGQSRQEVVDFQEQFNAWLTANNQEIMLQHFSNEFVKQLDSARLSETMIGLEKQFGTIASIAPQPVRYEAPYWVIENLCTFSKGGVLKLRYAVNKRLKLEGLFFLPSPTEKAPYSNPAWLSTPAKEVDVVIGEKTEFPLPGKWIATEDKDRVVIFIHGSGPNDMDETIYSNRPFYELAQGFAQQGIASIRYNKRTFEHPQKFKSDTPTIGIETLEDVKLAVQLARNQGYSKIFLFGHSLGGMVTANLVNELSLAGGITFGAPYSDLEDLILYQMDYLGEASKEEMKELAVQVENAKNAKANADLKKDAFPFAIGAQYWISLHDLHHRSAFEQCSAPLMLAFGGKDYQVPTKEFKKWKKVLKSKAQVEVVSFPNLNHLLMPSDGSMKPSEYEKPNHIELSTISTMASWIKKHN